MQSQNNNVFLLVKAAVAALCGAFTAAFGWLGWLAAAWVLCMVLDWLSGAARAGIWHKFGMILVVLATALTDAVLGMAVVNLPGLGLRFDALLLPVVLVWYIFTELGSVAENAAALGAPVPKVLLDALAVGKREP